MPSSFIESIRQVLRTKHYSLRTEKNYLYWVRYFIRFHQYMPPKDTQGCHIEQFLTFLGCLHGVTDLINANFNFLLILKHLQFPQNNNNIILCA
ncbi:phage integrase N-terminal SAM-like domain-containing protein [Shewanella sp. 1CM18E]|uniref:phage integrase N-terminal SAM-like domain-containing protein n=1 Tax=Shewanella sp. 1CM18E TaxID=2929169 RepID=UPI0020C10FDB|nr:phage integrase N-terminal SAM-like domain-containing protein [Shewanella sp. 1CM18E]MCK8044218.1 phage integrase N-terminal SAM-like domain-containing protein [Shewanella sp. 1CM18E]